jgi:hydrogenase expression/formation protein HypC
MAGVTREASIALLAGVQVGDYVLVHAGYAIQRLDEEEAQETLKVFDQINAAIELEEAERGR